MPLTLTDPLVVGALDPSAPVGASGYPEYTTCRLKLMGNHPEVADNPHMRVNIAYGYMVDDVFVRGKAHPDRDTWPETYEIKGADYITEVTTAAPKATLVDPSDPDYIEIDDGGTPIFVELIYVASKRALYEHVISKGIIPAGTIF
jgi:hypothetical protein